MIKRYVVLDTNCLLRSISQRSQYYQVWTDFLDGKYVLCVSNEILEEYEEIISLHMSPLAAKIVIETILRANNVLRVDAQFRFGLITVDVDDNKFVDCAIVANADYIVSDDKHFGVLQTIAFPHVVVRKLDDFYQELTNSNN
ncbi:MAG: putative toxin-antitoxin system toxin component, PIN family [Prevotella sp.]|nr:putative toxin-antitoxin system toxin component, PIN family [Prevotella sp.]